MKHVCHDKLLRPCIMRCLIIILIFSILSHLYLILNVPTIHEFIRVSQHSKFEDKSEKKSSSIHTLNSINKYKCEVIHLAMVCAGYESTLSLATTVKSILYYRTLPINLHLLLDETAMRTLTTLFVTWDLPHVNVFYHRAEDWIPRVSWIPNRHYSGVYGLLKLIMPEVLKVPKVLVVDTDVTFLNDISILWKLFNEFHDDQLLGLVENQSDWYKSLVYSRRAWPALERGFNTGIMLMNLKGLRARNFSDLWKNITEQVLETHLETILADQDVINAVIKKHPNIIYRVDCTWNIQLSDKSIGESCYSNAKQLNAIHWNSPRKQNVQIAHVNDFRQMHRIILELNGSLLRRTLFNCHHKSEELSINENSSPCREFIKGANLKFRTHLFLLEYEYNIHSSVDVVLATQCSANRAILLEEISKNWRGTISVALYLTDDEVQSFLEFVKGSEELRTRKNIAYHVVYKDGDFYPVNYLRNVAMLHIPTSYVFQLDIDFIPNPNLHSAIMKYIISLNITESSKTALIVPAFETQRYKFTYPVTKEELLKSWSRGLLYTFRFHVWSQGHAATNYTFWKNASEPYEVSWEPDFEPYIVVPRSAPKYDTRFIGFGWNKVSHVTHLTALGYRYFVLPDTFIIHRPHAPSRDIAKFRINSLYRRCLKRLKDTFVLELIEEYGKGALSKSNRSVKD